MYRHSEIDRRMYERFSADAMAGRSNRHQLKAPPLINEQLHGQLKSPWPAPGVDTGWAV